MGKCCGASRGRKRADRARERQRELDAMSDDLDQIMGSAPARVQADNSPARGDTPRRQARRGAPPPTGNLPPPPTGGLPPPPLLTGPLRPIGNLPPPPGGLPPPLGGPPARPKASDLIPTWKRAEQVRIAGRYGEMVFERDDGPDAIGGVKMHQGRLPGIKDGESARGKAFDDFSAEDKAMIVKAQEAIASVRADLPRGAFNNYAGLPAEVQERQNIPGTDRHAPGWWNNVVDEATKIGARQLAGRLPDVNAHQLQLACLARATKAVGGGVCSKMATMTSAVLSTTMPPGSEIAQVFHGYDHEFVIARAPGSDWFVVDPWPEMPLTIPVRDCDFHADGMSKFIVMNVTETAPPELPFGIDVETGMDWPAIVEEAKRRVPRDQPLQLAHNFRQATNVKNPTQFAPELRAGGSDNWG